MKTDVLSAVKVFPINFSDVHSGWRGKCKFLVYTKPEQRLLHTGEYEGTGLLREGAREEPRTRIALRQQMALPSPATSTSGVDFSYWRLQRSKVILFSPLG